MVDFKGKACELIERLPEQKVKLIFALLFETALNGDIWESDMDYFNSIPGYVDSLIENVNTQLEECEEDIGWNIP